MNTVQFFEKSKVNTVIETLVGLLSSGWTFAIASSFGKDSSVLLSLAMEAARQCVARGIAIEPLVVTHADTGVDAPEVRNLADTEIAKLYAFAKQHNITLIVDIAKPGAFSTFQAKIIGGRGLPTFEDSSSRDCTIDLKITAQQRQRNRIMKELGGAGRKVVTLLGVRYEESPDRAQRMADRGDSATVPQLQNGQYMLSPISDFDQSDIWTHVAQCQSGVFESYSDFKDLTRIYADSAGTSCFVVGDDITQALKNKRACGARTGCYVCGAIGQEDTSMSAMIEADDRYGYLQPLADFRLFLRATRFDMKRRNWIMRSIEDGVIRLKPDAYAPDMLEELLRICLTIDRREQVRASRAKERVKFQIIGLQDLVAIDFQWSRYGLHKPFHALHIYFEVMEKAKYTEIPKIPMDAFPRIKGMSTVKGEIPVDFDFERQDGLSNFMLEAFASECGFEAIQIGETTVTDYGRTQNVEIDEEGAELFLCFEAEDKLREYHRDDIDPTVAARTYLQYGTVMLSAKGTVDNDKIVRRTQAMWRAGFTGAQDHESLLAMSRKPTKKPADQTAEDNTSMDMSPETASQPRPFPALDPIVPLDIDKKPVKTMSFQLELLP